MMNSKENGRGWKQGRRVDLQKEVDPVKEKVPQRKPFTMIVTDREEPIFTLINKINVALKTHIEERPTKGKVAVFYPLHQPKGPVADRITELVLTGTSLLDAEVQAMYEQDHGRTPDGITFTLRKDQIEEIVTTLNETRTEHDQALVEVLNTWTMSYPGKLLMVPDTKIPSHQAQDTKGPEKYDGSKSDVDKMIEHTRQLVEIEATAESTQRIHSATIISEAMDWDQVDAGIGLTASKNTLISRDLRKAKHKGQAKYDVRNIYPNIQNGNQSDDGKTIYYLAPEDALIRTAQVRKVRNEEVVLTQLSKNETYESTKNQELFRDRYAWIHEKLTNWDIEEYKHEAFEAYKKKNPEIDTHAQWQRDIIESAIASKTTENPDHTYTDKEINVMRDNFYDDIVTEEKRWKEIIEKSAENKLLGLPHVTYEERQQALADSEREYLLLLSKVLEKKIKDPKKIGGEFFLVTSINPLPIAEKLQEEQRKEPHWLLEMVVADLYEVASELVITDDDILRIEKEEERNIIDAFEKQFSAEPEIGNSGTNTIAEQEDDKNDDEKGTENGKGKSK